MRAILSRTKQYSDIPLVQDLFGFAAVMIFLTGMLALFDVGTVIVAMMRAE